MKYVFRLLWLVLTARRRSPCNVLDVCRTPCRVWPNDLDVFMHMNNGAYLTMADLGRTDLILRSGLFAPLRQRGWYPVMAAETIRFRRSLTLWQRYTIATRIVGWDERSFFLEQVFSRPTRDGGEELVAHALIDARFLQRGGGSVTTAEVTALGDAGATSPPLPEHVSAWLAASAQLREQRGAPLLNAGR